MAAIFHLLRDDTLTVPLLLLAHSHKVPLLSDPSAPPIANPVILLAFPANQGHAYRRRLALEDLANACFASLSADQEVVELRMRDDVAYQPIFVNFTQVLIAPTLLIALAH